MNNTPLALALPRLRLPQKERATRPTAKPATWARHSVELSPVQRRSIPDIPTRPAPTAPQRLAPRPLTIGVGWHRGLTRSHDPNEDSLVFLQGMCTYHDQLMPFSLFVIADGMGGHDCGQEASRLAMHTMMYTVLQNIVMGNELTDEYLLDMLTGGVQWANLAVCKAAQEQQNDMGTTLTAALVIGVHAYVVNVGDSRVYRYRANARQHLKQITRDHSLVAHLVETGEIAPNAIYTHPDRNQVYRCLGNDEELEIDGFMETLQAGDRLLLCSDGLWEMVHNPEIERLLSYEVEPGHACDLLVKESLRAGGCDNVSVIVARVPE